MPLLSPILRNLNMNPSCVSFICNDPIETLIAPGYLSTASVVDSMNTFNNGTAQFENNDFFYIEYLGGQGVFTYNENTNTLVTFTADTVINYTPVVTFSTPGDLGVVYGSRTGKAYVMGGKMCYVKIVIVFTPLYTTSTGSLLISTPFVASEGLGGNIQFTPLNITYPAGMTQIQPIAVGGTANSGLRLFGSAAAPVDVTTTQIISGTSYNFQYGVYYFL